VDRRARSAARSARAQGVRARGACVPARRGRVHGQWSEG
jgi:hypothetical protein